ncbi:hypothetical protein ACFVFS_17590 [Kitasatospora sp. NPDC057692]|uniref:hypothetical protein n=1 Tax=Kitasatospora sp. NPDC057692 TaxID=3346215 RepID=UPI003681CB71
MSAPVVMPLQDAAAEGLLGWHVARAEAVCAKPTPTDGEKRTALIGEMRGVIGGLVRELKSVSVQAEGYRRLLEPEAGSVCSCGCNGDWRRHSPVRGAR